ncbi:ABC transporter substrate-binding protein [Teichococcus cervicalis]
MMHPSGRAAASPREAATGTPRGTTRRGLLLGAGAALAAARPAQAQPRGPELRIGAIYPAAGPLALPGDESFRGLELAVEARNEAGGLLGRPLRLVKAEANDAAQAGEAVRRLAGTERLVALFGTTASPLSFAATQAAELAGMAYFELGAIADTITARGFRYLFRSGPRATDYAALGLRTARETLPGLWGLPLAGLRIAIAHEDGLYGQSVAAAQEAGLQGGEAALLGRFAYAPGGQDLPALVARLRSADAQLLLHTGQAQEVLALFRAMKEAGWRPRMVLGSGGGYALADTAQSLGPALEGVLNVGFPPYASAGRLGEEAKRVAEAYRLKYGHDPRSAHSLANHAGARLFLDAIHRAGGTEREKLRGAVLATELDTAEAPLGWAAAFDEAGQNQRARPVLSQWQGGRLVAVAPEGTALAAPRGEMG